ncbi:hypothetical protein FB45DRAFT_88686 [Roridomyces roridus]|uniref:Uncharacterized protein n=1 Tax=Roridomyces roridus TaxID=1738132 RepID=A0AAD7BM08_9AGAR|nr:hypothetical protein FB45DRAFT_88686 [Roridomyces roridus]
MSRIQTPTTPVSAYSHSRSYSHKPINSSPLAGSSSSPGSSPIAAVQARRRSQYKAPRASASLSLGSSSRSSSSTAATRLDPLDFSAGPDQGDDAQKAFLRTRLKLRCIERANKARERAVQKKRFMNSSEFGSDDVDMDMDGEDTGDGEFDVLFTRIMQNTTRKLHHAYMYSYDREFGSDPINEEAWEAELTVDPPAPTAEEELEDDAVLQALLEEQAAADEQEAAAALADFADLAPEELFGGLSDFEDDVLSGSNAEDVDMS